MKSFMNLDERGVAQIYNSLMNLFREAKSRNSFYCKLSKIFGKKDVSFQQNVLPILLQPFF